MSGRLVALAAALALVSCADRGASDTLARAAALQQERARLGCTAETLGCRGAVPFAAAGFGR